MSKRTMAFVAALFFLTMWGSVAVSKMPKAVPFVHSSLDMNDAKPHSTSVSGIQLEALIKKITALGEKRGLVLVSKNCPTKDECHVVYKRTPQNRSKVVGYGSTYGDSDSGTGSTTGSSHTNTYNLDLSSKIFADLRKEKNGIAVELIGVPVVNETMSCPEILAGRNECKPQPFYVKGKLTPAESFMGIWGVDISGRAEADIITGIIAELN